MQGRPCAEWLRGYKLNRGRGRNTMEFLKSIFGEKALTYAELEAALKDSKEIKLGNLASGQYVDKAKLDGKINELATANQTIKDLQETIKKFDGVDVESLKKAATDWETKYNADTAKLRLEKEGVFFMREKRKKCPLFVPALSYTRL